AESVIASHTVINGPTVIGAGCKIGPAAYVGLDPQHLDFLTRPDKPVTWLTIGDRTIIREMASVHRATRPGIENATRVGNDCLLMGAIHVAHDCVLGDRVIMANGALLGGHCQIGDRAFLGGGCTMHQFARIGRLALVGGNEPVSRDVPPFGAARYGGLKGYNAIGCRRAGLSREAIASIRKVFYCIHTNRTTQGLIAAIRQLEPQTDQTRELLDFLQNSKRGMHPSVRFLNYLNQSESDSE
ncbi:MAG TPA: hypothetical protein VHS31_03040, partial [Tepidisphaeraceae bacterium]|nr:hypothetical protein [Tepidisphaeraceae bacterium]